MTNGTATMERRDDVRKTMGIVTDREEWKPLLAMLAQHDIHPFHVIILQQHLSHPEQRGFQSPELIEVEIRNPATWTMDHEARAELEAEIRQAAGEWGGSGLSVAWRRPVPMAWIDAAYAVRDGIWREFQRGRVDRVAFMAALDALRDLHEKVWTDGRDIEPLLPQLNEIAAEARRHPAPPKDLPPLNPNAVGVGEVMALLRKIAAGEHPVVMPEGSRWKDVQHGVGTFQVDGWTIKAFRRSTGMKYVQQATAPDGRTSSYDDFEKREGDPYCLLEDAEQDAVDRLLDAS